MFTVVNTTHEGTEVRIVVFGDNVTSYQAYDETQTSWLIQTGDLLVVPLARIVGVMVDAWPVAVIGPGRERGAFHELAEDHTWKTLEGGRYEKTVAVARDIVFSDERMPA
jgi:hypothetical protein